MLSHYSCLEARVQSRLLCTGSQVIWLALKPCKRAQECVLDADHEGCGEQDHHIAVTRALGDFHLHKLKFQTAQGQGPLISGQPAGLRAAGNRSVRVPMVVWCSCKARQMS